MTAKRPGLHGELLIGTDGRLVDVRKLSGGNGTAERLITIVDSRAHRIAAGMYVCKQLDHTTGKLISLRPVVMRIEKHSVCQTRLTVLFRGESAERFHRSWILRVCALHLSAAEVLFLKQQDGESCVEEEQATAESADRTIVTLRFFSRSQGLSTATEESILSKSSILTGIGSMRGI